MTSMSVTTASTSTQANQAEDFRTQTQISNLKYDLADKLYRPARYIGTVASLVLGVYTAYSLPWILAARLIGGALMYFGSTPLLQITTFLIGCPLSLMTKEAKTFAALNDRQFIEFAKENQMDNKETIVKAHTLYQEKLAKDSAAVKAKIAAPTA